MIEIINLKREKPSEEWDFIVDRTTSLGNQYFMMTEADRDKACDWYDIWFENLIRTGLPSVGSNYLAVLISCYKVYGKLRLFCWCPPKRCHAETIRNYILKRKGE